MRKIKEVVAGSMLAVMMAGGASAGGETDRALLLELKKMIEQQQQQINQQAQEISRLKELVQVPEGGGDNQPREPLPEPVGDKAIVSTFENVDINLYGQLNKGVLYADTGDASTVAFVDNSNSQSRIGINVSVDPAEEWKIGGKIEYGIKSNATLDVSQEDSNNATSVTWNLRHADIFINNTTFGRVSLGYGSTASDNSAEVDLSGTSVVAYADVAALAGGQYWYDTETDDLPGLQVKSVFNDLDGLGRDDRIRYDTPSLAGFSIGGSAVSGDAYDAVLSYSRVFGSIQMAGALAWAKTGDIYPDADDQYDGSFSVLLGNGLNATVSAGVRDMMSDTRDDGTFWYAKLGYRAALLSFGKTSFSVDYGENENIANNGETATTWSVAAVQDMSSWGTEVYLAFRNYQLDSDLTSFDDVNAVLAGARVKF